MKAIETKYKGYRFRSRLEARWAVFFDALGLQWEYEPAGFKTSKGAYLPDFFLPIVGGGVWVEIKHEHLTKEERNDARVKLSDVSFQTGKKAIIFMGDPLSNILCDGGDPPGSYDGTASWIIVPDGSDGPYLFCICPWTGNVGIEFDGRGERVKDSLILTPDEKSMIDRREAIDCESFYGHLAHGDKAYSGNHPRLISAAKSARSARFEHGERG